MRRAREAIARADHVLFVIDAVADPHAQSWTAEHSALPEGVPVTLVMNKSDLLAGDAASAAAVAAGMPQRLAISATTGDGLPALRALLVAAAGRGDAGAGAFSARGRHVDALRRSAQYLDAAHRQLVAKQGELAALELRNAQKELGEVVGDVSSDELLGHIFGSFCIGK